jgi:multiple antibiotic resistance protein
MQSARCPSSSDSQRDQTAGVPLIVGPGVLATILILLHENGFPATVSATLINILLAGFIFWMSRSIGRVLGKAGSKTASKLAGLLLASIGVMMVRRGVVMIVASGGR